MRFYFLLLFCVFAQAEPISPLSYVYVNSLSEKYKLGLMLFQDKRLSKDSTISCSSCHNLSTNGADTRTFSIGVNGSLGKVNTPTVFNSSLNFAQFWDGRAKTLEDQIDGPLQHEAEMGSNWDDVIKKLKADSKYPAAFKAIYRSGITVQNIKDAISNFEGQLITPNSKFDRFLKGEKNVLNERELQGYRRFKVLGCISCHQGYNIGGNMFQTMGIMGNYFKDRKQPMTNADFGRFNVTQKEEDKFVFRVPGLRNVAITPPYFHDGYAKNLEDAVRIMGLYQLGKNLKKDDVNLITEFLRTLTGELPPILKAVNK